MKNSTTITAYSPAEEKLNVRSHAVGVLFAIVAFVLLMIRAASIGDVWHWVAYTIYGVSIFTIFLASTLYHKSKKPAQRLRLKVFDHAAIYLSIAGTYTPFTLITLRGSWGWTIFGIVWGIAIAGIVLKIFFAGRYRLLSTIGYVAMGWIVVIAIKPLINNLSFAGLMWLAAGGFLYTSGAVIYQIKRIPYNHAIFHFFVLSAAVCHFIAVYLYTK
ncbi:PAQR family membrane homeostasis protein TrhA [Natronoflexus pectinivorans]|uniref:Hemolysin III n=1 Tax=Natronoflexus pectinivorans TaxID=682526 RepID=A0A4R2GCF9_9BACT|nr:hemolysin III family protein [Natronoflexus pectinivorans]TCO05432.1 hemolysin III [Natronoflexus pectinivorans]